jgi:hypothetical protein
MSSEIQSLRAEVAALRGEVRRKRQRGRLLPVAIVALFVALIPGLAIAANPFNDLVGGSPHNGNIDAIYNARITTGCVPNQAYCPTDLVTRQEMASFLARTAGLGGNPAVTNAATLQGFSPSGLVRASNGGSNGNAIPLASTFYTVLAQTTITAPSRGYIVLSASTVIGTSPSGTQLVDVLLRFRNGNAATPDQEALVGTVAGSAAIMTVSPTNVFTVTSPGSLTFVLEAAQNPIAGSAAAFRPNITAIFIPFGPGGAIASEDTQWGPASAPEFEPR